MCQFWRAREFLTTEKGLLYYREVIKKNFFKPIKKNAIIICPKGPNWERMKSLRKAVTRHGHVPQLARLGLDYHS